MGLTSCVLSIDTLYPNEMIHIFTLSYKNVLWISWVNDDSFLLDTK
jgi:hypothetical protein